MKKRISLKLDNKGSGIITVLVAVVFLVLMGSLILMLTFTGFEMRTSDREGKKVSYDAATAMDEVKLGIQQAVSTSIESSYSSVLSKYTEKGAEIQNEFSDLFINSFKKYQTVDEKGEKANLLYEDGGKNYYNINAINNMIIRCRRGSAEIITPAGQNLVVKEADGSKITFKNIKVKYTDGDRSQVISTDVVVTVPNIGYTLSSFSISGIPSFAVIAGGELSQTDATTSVTSIRGGAYMKDLVLSGNSQIELVDGIFVCGGDIDISGSYATTVGAEGSTVEKKGRIIVDNESTLWTNNIIIHGNTNASFLGNTYVFNDLKFNGKNSDVTLAGTYSGFGTGGDDRRNANTSSSIIVNDKGNKLNIDNLSALTIAGCSFVGEKSSIGTPNGPAVKMGESISVKENQRVYLIPEKYIYYVGQDSTPAKSNPEIFSSDYTLIKKSETEYTLKDGMDVEKRIDLKKDATLWTKDGKNMTFNSYNAELQPVYTNFSNQVVIYYFLKFNDTYDGENLVYSSEENANRYFKDYMAANPTDIQSYIKKYLTISSSNVASQTMGNFFVGGGENVTFRQFLSNGQATGVLANAKEYQTLYSNVCQTLSYDVSSGTANDNPFTYYINSEKIASEIGENTAREFVNGDIKAVVVNGDYTYSSSSDEKISLIIATGTVTIEKEYEGLVMCGGNLELKSNASLKANSSEVEKAYAAVYEGTSSKDDDRLVGDYFKVPIGENNSWSVSAADSITSISGLVTYSNWKKN